MRWYKKDGRCWAGNGGRGKGRSWSCAVCVHEQGQGWVSSLPALLLAASFCIKPLTCCSSAGWAWARGKRAARVRGRRWRRPALDTNTHDGTCTHAYTHIIVCCCYDKSVNTHHHQPKKQTSESQQRQQTATTASAARGSCPATWGSTLGCPLWWPLVVNVKCILPIPDPQPAIVCVRCLFLRQHQSCHLHPATIYSPISICVPHVNVHVVHLQPGGLSWTRDGQRTAQHSMAQA